MPPEGADLFHGTLVAGFAQWCARAAAETGIRTVTLGGGCFFNKVLTAGLAAALQDRGLTALTALKASPGDPGLSLGQAWIAAQVES
jgi:Hydrogenase maturation factor